MKYKIVKPHCVDCKQVDIPLMKNTKCSYMCRPCKATRQQKYYWSPSGSIAMAKAKARYLAKKALLNKA